MKLIMDERIKHRVIGLAVILSLIAIFMPAMIKKSNQRFDNIRLAVKLPPKPDLPRVVIPEKQTMFKAVKVARMDLPAIPMKPEAKLAETKKLMVLVKKPVLEDNTHVSSMPSIVFAAHAAPSNVKRVTAGLAKKTEKKILKTEKNKRVSTRAPSSYAVQLAAFIHEKNAKALMSTLHAKGYPVVCHKIVTKQGNTAYRILVGQAYHKVEAHHLRQQLANKVRLEGFVVSTGIG